MSEVELQEMEKTLRAAVQRKAKPAAEQLQSYLHMMRDSKIRDSASVAMYGALLLKHYRTALSEEELWLVHEQVAMAALDSGALPYAIALIRALKARFPESVRAKRLQGMYFEASADYDRAEAVYREILANEPANETAVKRLVALEKSRGNVPAAIDQLRKFLDVQCSDMFAWEELAELYLEVLMYRQAAFCYEELLMLQPLNTTYLLRYADTLYTIGGPQHYRTARSYYSKVVELTAGASARALFGVLSCTANITEKVALQDSRTRAQIELPELCAQALARLYRSQAPAKLPLVVAMLDKQGYN